MVPRLPLRMRVEIQNLPAHVNGDDTALANPANGHDGRNVGGVAPVDEGVSEARARVCPQPVAIVVPARVGFKFLSLRCECIKSNVPSL